MALGQSTVHHRDLSPGSPKQMLPPEFELMPQFEADERQ
jgi:hypothetical protein